MYKKVSHIRIHNIMLKIQIQKYRSRPIVYSSVSYDFCIFISVFLTLYYVYLCVKLCYAWNKFGVLTNTCPYFYFPPEKGSLVRNASSLLPLFTFLLVFMDRYCTQ